MKRWLSLMLLLAVLYNSLQAQANPNNPALSNGASVTDEIINLSSGGYYNTSIQFDNRYKGIEGTPFLWDTWLSGILYLTDTTRSGTPLVYKFDAYSNEIWCQDRQGREIILYSNQFRGLDMLLSNGSIWALRKMVVPGSTDPHRFYHVLYADQHYALFEHRYKVIKRAQYQDRGIYTSGNTNDVFEEKTTLWMQREGSAAQEIAWKKSALLKALSPSDITPAEAYCKKHSLKGKLTEQEAIALLKALGGK